MSLRCQVMLVHSLNAMEPFIHFATLDDASQGMANSQVAFLSIPGRKRGENFGVCFGESHQGSEASLG